MSLLNGYLLYLVTIFLFRHVVTGESLTSLGYQFRVGKATVHKIVKETSKAIWETLQPQYLPVPDEHQWEEIARTFF